MNIIERNQAWQRLFGKDLIERMSENILECTGLMELESTDHIDQIKRFFEEHQYPVAELQLWIKEKRSYENGLRILLENYLAGMKNKGFSDYHCMANIFGVLGLLADIGVKKPEVIMFYTADLYRSLLQKNQIAHYVEKYGAACVSEILNKMADDPSVQGINLDEIFCDEDKHPYDAVCDITGNEYFPVNYRGL